MITQRYFERDGGRTLFRFAVDDSSIFDVLSTDVDLEHCRALLRGELARDVEIVRMGDFGPFEAVLIRNLDGVGVQSHSSAARDS